MSIVTQNLRELHRNRRLEIADEIRQRRQTYEQIGKAYGICRERVRQIAKMYGLERRKKASP